MKHLFIALFMLFATTVSAQEVIDFMGIPIDGSKAEMFAKLKEKGFRETEDLYVLQGLFEDIPVEAMTFDFRDKVYNITLRHDMGNDETMAIEQYNNLILKFRNDPKYNDSYSELIPEGELIGEKLRSDFHLYTACFTQSGKHGYVRIKLLKTNNWKDEEWYKLANYVVEIEYINAANSPRG